MAPNRNTARPKGTPGVKALVTTASLAATLAGWATLSAHTPAPTAAQVVAPTDIDQARIVMAPPPAWLRESPSLPTILEVATVRPAAAAPVVAARPNQAAAPVAAAPVAAAPVAAAPVAVSPPAAPAPTPALREVTPPPAPPARPAAPPPAPPAPPVTNTQSSK